MIQTQKEKLQVVYETEGMEMETGLVRISMAGRPAIGSGDYVHPSAKAKAAPKSRAGNKQRSTSGGGGGVANNPVIAASKARTRTTKEWAEAQRILNRAVQEAESVLQVSAPKILDPESVPTDPTLDLLRNRLALVRAAMDKTSGQESVGACERLYDLACLDPYLKDCKSTILADPEACQTWGSVAHCRQFVFDMCLFVG